MSEAATPVVDLHTHLWTPWEMDESGQAEEFRLDNLLAHRELNGIDISCVSNTLHYSQIAGRGVFDAVDDVRKWHDFAVDVHAENPGVYFWASTIPMGGQAYLDELDRVLSEPAFVGVMINSSYGEAQPDDDSAQPFWQYANDRGLAVYMHPPFHICGDERLQEFRFVSSLGRPNDVLRGLARVIVGGVLERAPRVRLVASHLGGSICDFVNRLDYAYDLRAELKGLGDYGTPRITRSPSSYLRDVWLETSAYPSQAIDGAVATVGVEHVVMGSDTPPMMALGTRPMDMVRQTRRTPAEQAAILGGNAVSSLGLDVDLGALTA